MLKGKGGMVKIFTMEFLRERILWIVIIAVLIMFMIGMIAYIASFRSHIISLQQQIAKENEKLKIALRDIPTLDYSDIERLKDYGLQDPVTDITVDLKKHPELIPYEAVLGGTMRFHKAYVLTPEWVLANFDDGHIGGHMLLEYDVSDGTISWRIVASYLY